LETNLEDARDGRVGLFDEIRLRRGVRPIVVSEGPAHADDDGEQHGKHRHLPRPLRVRSSFAHGRDVLGTRPDSQAPANLLLQPRGANGPRSAAISVRIGQAPVRYANRPVKDQTLIRRPTHETLGVGSRPSLVWSGRAIAREVARTGATVARSAVGAW